MRYRLDSMLPLRAFSPRSGRARGFAAGGMTLEGDGGQQYWQDAPPADSSVTVEAAPPEFNNATPIQTGPAPDQGGGGGDQGGGGQDINQIYQQYLGRNADESGAATYAGWAPQDIVNAIQGSQEYANRGSSGGGGGGGGGSTDGGLNQIYQQYLGRNVDPSGAQTFAGWNPQDVISAIQGSAEYSNRAGASAAPTAGGTDINSLYQQYLGRSADQSGLATWANQSPEAVIAGITGSQEYQNLHPGAQPVNPNATPDSPDQWIPQVVGRTPGEDGHEIFNYVDQKTGNVYDSQSADAKLIISGEAARDKYIAPLEYLTNDEKQALYNTKTVDPKQYYNDVAAALGKQLFTEYSTNSNTSNSYNALQSLKEVAPQEYYKAQLDFLGKQVGWQIGQNTSERNAPILEEIKKLAPAAYQSGIGVDDINSIVNTAANQANIQNQQRIANDLANGGSGFSFQKDLQPGLAMIAMAAAGVASGGAALAIGEAALGVGAAGAATLGGAVVGAGMGALNAAAYNGNIGQGAIKGAIAGGVGGAGSEMSAASGLVGSETIKAIAEASQLSPAQVAGIISNTAATTIAAAATGQINSSNIAQTIGTALASSAIGAYSGKVALAIDPNMSNAAINAVSSIARIATTATLNGGNVSKAIISNIPSIINSAVGTTIRENQQNTQLGLDVANKSNDPIGALNATRNWTGLTSDNADTMVNNMISQGYNDKSILGALQNNFKLDPQSALTVFNDTARLPDASLLAQTPSQGPLTKVPEANTAAYKAAVDSGDKELIAAVKSGDTKVINAINNGDMIGAIALSKETSGIGTLSPLEREAYQRAVANKEKSFEVDGKTYPITYNKPEVPKNDPEFNKAMSVAANSGSKQFSYNGNTYTLNQQAPATNAPLTNAPVPQISYKGGLNTEDTRVWDEMGNVISGTAAGINPNSAGVKFVNDIQSKVGDLARFGVSAGSQGMAELGKTYSNALSSTPWFDNDNAFSREADKITKSARDLMPADVKEQEKNITDRIKAADGITNKMIEGIKAAYENPKGFASYLARESIQEGLQLASGVAAFKLAGYIPALGTDIVLQAGESYGDAYGEAYKAFKAQGLSNEEARQKSILPAAIAGAATAVTSGVVDATLLKGLTSDLVQAGFVKSGMSVATKELGTEYVETIVQSMAVQQATTGKIDWAKAQDEATLLFKVLNYFTDTFSFSD